MLSLVLPFEKDFCVVQVITGEEDQTLLPNEGPATRQPTGRITNRAAAQIKARTGQVKQY
jgi:hypothetical protein